MVIKLVALALGNFAVGTAELMIAGILPEIAQDTNISVSEAGQLVSAYAIFFAIAAPVLFFLTSKIERRLLLCSSLIIFIFGNLLTILVSDYWLLMLARIIAATGSAIYSAAAVTVAANLAPAEKRGRTIAIVVAGWSLAAVLGAPLGTLVGQQFGWRSSFILVIFFSASAAAGIYLRLSRIVSNSGETIFKQFSVLAHPGLIAALGVSAFFLAGQYAIYTYIAPFFNENANLSGTAIGGILLIYGVAGTLGNFLGGFGTDRIGTNQMLVVCISLNLISIMLLAIAGTTAIGAFTITAVWGLSSWAFTSSQQCYLVQLAPHSTGLVMSLNISAFNVGIASGAGLGGLVSSNSTHSNINWAGSTLVAIALGLLAYSFIVARRKVMLKTQP